MIVLLGAEISYAHQHVRHFNLATDYRATSTDFRRRYALHILRLIIRRFQKGQGPLTADQIAEVIRLPNLIVTQLIDHLRESGLVSAVKGEKNNAPLSFQPARDIKSITIGSVLEALDKRGQKNWPANNDPEFARVSQAVDEIQTAINNSPVNRLVKDI